jgi:hypothetical protein
MTPDRFRECLHALHWSQRGLADILKMDERQVRRWAAGAEIPVEVSAWLEGLAKTHERNPPPVRVPSSPSMEIVEDGSVKSYSAPGIKWLVPKKKN